MRLRNLLTPGVIAAVASHPVDAQVVRGRITEVATAAPVAGALVSLLPADHDSSIVSGLSTRFGDYALRAPTLGRYRLAVKRIGVRRFVSAPFDLGSGETRALDVPIDAIAMALPQVDVSGLCVTRPRDLRRVASLWDEARTALEATEISLRDQLIRANITRYAAELEPSALRVLFDWRSDAQLMVRQPFTSLSGDSLSAVGYWRLLPGDSVEYLAPDASALASNAFIRDHCFGLAATPRDRPDLVGLTFEPARDRDLPDITGTIWLDARRFELQFIEFRYTRLPRIPSANRVGGEVHFSRTPTGAWIVDRWFIRMPQVVVPAFGLPSRQLREEGGSVVADSGGAGSRLAAVGGVFRDSGGRPVGGAVVRAIGTPRQVVTRADGSYQLDSLPPGELSVVAHTDGYDALATLAATRRVSLLPARSQRVDLRAPNTAALRQEFCPPASRLQVARGVLRLLMVDSATATPIPGIRFIATWSAAAEIPNIPDQERYSQAVSDSRGAATFCDLPTGIDIEVSLLSTGGHRSWVMTTQLVRNGVLGRVVAGRLNR